jgi:Mrp family chromosome partitioning ATPase
MQTVHPVRPVAKREDDGSGAAVATMVESHSVGSLSLLASGGEVPNPPALLAGTPMTQLLQSLGSDHESVLVDAPSPLEFSDAMPLLPAVDGIVLVARIGHTREASARKLVELLAHVSCAPVLGAVVNCVSKRDLDRYGFSAREARPVRRKPIRK